MNRRAIALSFVAACALCIAILLLFALLVPEPASWALWVVTVLVTYLVSRYQRRTGPGYDIPASCELGGSTVSVKLPTSYARGGDCPIRVHAASADTAAVLCYRRYPTSEEWVREPFVRTDEGLVAHVPLQPPAGKVEYHVEVTRGGETCTLPRRDNVIVRFRGSVSAAVLVPHVLLMLAGMILSLRAGLEAWHGGPSQQAFAVLTLVGLVGGGMVFGPLVQKGAFGKYWTGVPFGTDLTDNKTLVAVLAWTVALVATFGGWSAAEPLRLAAAGVTLVAFLIPHSLFGSELKYEE